MSIGWREPSSSTTPPPPRSGRRFGWIALAILTTLLGVAAVAAPAVAHPDHAAHHPQIPPAPDQEVIVVARKLANGQVEFGLRQREVAVAPKADGVKIVIEAKRTDNNELEVERNEANEVVFDVVEPESAAATPKPWGEIQLPARRYFIPPALQFTDPTDLPTGPWLVSSEVKLTAQVTYKDSDGEEKPKTVDYATVRIAARRLANGDLEIALQKQDANGYWHDRQPPDTRIFKYTSAVGAWMATSAVRI